MPEFDDELSQIVAQLNRAAPGQHKTGTTPRTPESTASLDQLLAPPRRDTRAMCC